MTVKQKDKLYVLGSLLLIILSAFSLVLGVFGIIIIWFGKSLKTWVKVVVSVVGVFIVWYTGMWAAEISSSNYFFSTDLVSFIADNKKCERSGGYWRRDGLAGYYRCNHPYKDGGKTCTSSTECEGNCYATEEVGKGYCEYDDSPFGCYGGIIEDCPEGTKTTDNFNCMVMCVD